MFNISSYLEKFKKIDFGDGGLKDLLIKSIKEVVGVTLDRKQIKIQRQTAYITSTAIVKNQLAIKKQALMAMISQKTDKIKEIR